MYRPDIDGLRAVAVGGVVCAHAGWNWCAGGYTGVDVFFVISGFLITGILAREMSAGTFSLASFYERRARRILPALFAVLAVLLLAGAVLMMPWDFADLGKASLHAAGSVSNIHFRRVAEDYFARDAETNPALHTWSLAVEEQFYVVIPLLLWWCARKGGGVRRMQWMLALVAAASFAAAWWMVLHSRSAAFYLLPYRAWELSLGGLIALAPLKPLRPFTAQAAGLAGLALIAAGMLGFSADTLFPGPAALLPCTGAALVIWAGRAGAGCRLLQCRPLVFTGLISYSVYLWHWPLMAGFRIAQRDGANWPEWVLSLLPAVSLLLGWASWKWIETPFRRKFSRRWIFTASAAGAAAIAAAAIFASRSEFFYNRIPPEARRLAEFRHSWNPLEKERTAGLKEGEPVEYGAEGVPATLALWGDSHAGQLVYPLHEECVRRGLRFRFYGLNGTPPLPLSLANAAASGKAAAAERAFRQIMDDRSIRTVILAARWASYEEGSRTYGEQRVATHAEPLLPGARFGSEELYTAFEAITRSLTAQLLAAQRQVVLVYPVPEPGVKVPQFLAGEVIHGREPSQFTISAERVFFERQSRVLRVFDSLPPHPALHRIKPHEVLLRDGRIRLMSDPGGAVFYKDDDHLSVDGARLLLPLLAPVLTGSSQLRTP